ncbi:hypothetical protein I656_03059 [Geobacillus sp. WSUCF1]|nr:hypothetical protein I656_03059 [Geobacillus sp. WSUCF1]
MPCDKMKEKKVKGEAQCRRRSRFTRIATLNIGKEIGN